MATHRELTKKLLTYKPIQAIPRCTVYNHIAIIYNHTESPATSCMIDDYNSEIIIVINGDCNGDQWIYYPMVNGGCNQHDYFKK